MALSAILWGNRAPTPFILVFSDLDAAMACTIGQDGKTVACFDCNELWEDHLWKVQTLARDLEYYIPGVAWDNSEFE
jgi:hypothetical protein